VSDPLLEQLIAQAADDRDTLGLLLTGSRSVGHSMPDSDYDLVWVLTDRAYERRAEESGTREKRTLDRGVLLDVVYSCPLNLAQIAREPGWWTPGYASARVLVDKTGEVEQLLDVIAVIAPERVQGVAADAFDGYVNAFVRSVKAWRRGDELGARLQAAESVTYLVRTLFALEGLWAPYHDRLAGRLDVLDAQGWAPGSLQRTLFELVRSGDPRLQQRLEREVEALMSSRGIEPDPDWTETLERVRAYRFARRRRRGAPEERLRNEPTDDDIARRAYEISLRDDAGTSDENWARAEAELRPRQ
jgi:hypothetical protein